MQLGDHSPDGFALGVVVDLAALGAVLLPAAAEAVLQARRLPVVGVFSRDVAAVRPLAALHRVRTHDEARVAVRPSLRAPVQMSIARV